MRRPLAAVLIAASVGCAPPAAPAVAASPLPQAMPGESRIILDGLAVQGGIVRGRLPAGASGLTLTSGGGEAVAVPVAPDGAFVLGFDRDAAPDGLLVARLASRELRLPIAVAPRAWRIERIDAPLRAGRTTAEFDALRPIELAEIAAARVPEPTRADPGGWRAPLGWPGRGRISGLFGAQRVYQGVPGSYHSGIDLALPAGTPVFAPADGIVTLAADRPFTLEGRLLLVDHGGGLESAFLHLSAIDVRVGDRVRRGQPIGRVGATGRATGPHLHWGLRWQGARLDPLLAAEARPG